MNKLLLGCAMGALATSTAYAQSTGSIDFQNEIVVTATSVSGVAGVVAPDTSKAKAVLTQDFISNQAPGQTINDIINQLPGVSFQNNDPYGSAGGKLFIRGFDNTRISQTFDGVPLNDTGNYALYSNQQLDPELIEQVNVNLGTTDVDSPTAAASGSTVNYRTRNPTEDFHVRLQGSAGEYQFMRLFGVIDTGVIGPWGTRAFLAASQSTNDTVYGIGKIEKRQVNAKVYQPIGDDGDFVSIAGHYNENRNNFFGSVPLRIDTTGGRAAGPDSSNRFPLTKDERFYAIPAAAGGYPCAVTARTPGTAGAANTCGSAFDYRYNPSDTGNIRINSRFSLNDKLTLTVDPSYQYVKANGGGTVVGNERALDINSTGGVATCLTPATSAGAGISCQTGYINGIPYFGRDLNGDGDILDTVRLLAPSQTTTDRYGLIASLRYDINDDHSVRVAYTLDYGRHRQTGEVGGLDDAGDALTAFPVDAGYADATGNILQKRDRKSLAILNQVAGEYRGEFDALTVNVGVRAPFFKRDLTQNCFTSSAAGFVDCFGSNATGAAAYATLNPTRQGPQKRIFKFNKVLPNLGLIYDVAPSTSVFASYSKGLQVPGTDNLYQSFFYAPGAVGAGKPSPETTDNFDLGVRYRSSKVQAQLVGWYTLFQNRLASAYDRDQNITIYRNLGKVEKYGIDGNVSYSPVKDLSLYVFGSYLKSKIKDDIDAGSNCTAANIAAGQFGCTAVGQIAFFQTKGKRESGSPVYTLGARAEASVGPVTAGVQAKRTGARYLNDQNLPVASVSGAGVVSQLYPAKTPAYTLVDLDIRVSLEQFGLNDRTYFQLNVSNLFDKLYVGGFDGGSTSATSVTFANIGAPRAIVGTLVVGF